MPDQVKPERVALPAGVPAVPLNTVLTGPGGHVPPPDERWQAQEPGGDDSTIPATAADYVAQAADAALFIPMPIVPVDLARLVLACNGALVTLNLPRYADDQVGSMWALTTGGSTGDMGAHTVLVTAFDLTREDGVLVHMGERAQRISWPALREWGEEAFGLITADVISDGPEWIDRPRLMFAVREITEPATTGQEDATNG